MSVWQCFLNVSYDFGILSPMFLESVFLIKTKKCNGFDTKGTFGFPAIRFARNVIIFGADISSSPHIDNRKKDILVLGKGCTQRLENTLTAEKLFQLNLQSIIKSYP